MSLQVLAEGFSDAGVPVFAADIKGDLSGISEVGTKKDGLVKRAKDIGLDDWANTSYPTVFWDLFGEQGHPVRATVQDMGPLLLSRLLELNETQEGVLNILFRVAADEDMPLLDLKDLRAMANDVGQRGKSLMTKYGNVAAISVGAIQRRLLVLEEQGADNFFGEPALDIKDFMRVGSDGRGFINILAADKLMKTPRLYATFLLWMLAQLFDKLPEVGDPEKPKLVFFFDEAHLLFSEAPKALLEQVERVTRLIRSKGVGVYYVTQNPRDVPNSVSAQLGNRIQHALRAFTPVEQKGIRAAAETFRPNPKLDMERVIQELKVGEALVSVLHGGGEPSDHAAHADPPAVGAHRPGHAGGAQGHGRDEPDLRQVRGDGRPRLRPTRCCRSAPRRPPRTQERAGATAGAASSWAAAAHGRRQGYGETFAKAHHALGGLQHRQLSSCSRSSADGAKTVSVGDERMASRNDGRDDLRRPAAARLQTSRPPRRRQRRRLPAPGHRRGRRQVLHPLDRLEPGPHPREDAHRADAVGARFFNPPDSRARPRRILP